jgi:hypothetical protein
VSFEPTDVWKKTFKSKEGLFEWLVVPFGLTNASKTFTRMMENIPQPFTNCFVVSYLGNILIFKKTLDEPLKEIQLVMSTMPQHKLYANSEKCSFNMQGIQYLGYIVDECGACYVPTFT